MPLTLSNVNELEPQVFEFVVEGRPVTGDTLMSPTELWSYYKKVNKLLHADVTEADTNETISQIEPEIEIGQGSSF